MSADGTPDPARPGERCAGTPPLLPCQRHRFDMPHEVAYFNCAYMGPLMHEVIAAGSEGMRAKAQPWRLAPGDFFADVERARAQFAAIIGMDAEGVAVIPSASYGLSAAARNLTAGRQQTVLVLAEQFPSNVLVWRELAGVGGGTLCTVPRPEDADWTRATLAAIDEQTAIVALPHCHWADGGALDLVRIGRRCRAAGARLVLDLTQSAGALPFAGADIRPDYVVAAGYKWLLGPYSLGFLWVAPEHRDGRPIEFNWIARAQSEDFAGLVRYRDDYRPGARRFDVGETSNFILLPMLNAALERILAWGVDRIEATLAARNRQIAARVAPLGFRAMPEPLRAGHFLGLSLPPGTPPEPLARALAARGVHVSIRGESMRVTPHLYNTEEDVDRLVDALGPAADRAAA